MRMTFTFIYYFFFSLLGDHAFPDEELMKNKFNQTLACQHSCLCSL